MPRREPDITRSKRPTCTKYLESVTTLGAACTSLKNISAQSPALYTGGVVPEGVCTVLGNDDRGFAHWGARSAGGLYSAGRDLCANPRLNVVRSAQSRPRREAQCANPPSEQGPQCAKPGRAHWRTCSDRGCTVPRGSAPWLRMGIPGRHFTRADLHEVQKPHKRAASDVLNRGIPAMRLGGPRFHALGVSCCATHCDTEPGLCHSCCGY